MLLPYSYALSKSTPLVTDTVLNRCPPSRHAISMLTQPPFSRTPSGSRPFAQQL